MQMALKADQLAVREDQELTEKTQPAFATLGFPHITSLPGCSLVIYSFESGSRAKYLCIRPTAIFTKGPGEHGRLVSCDLASEGESRQSKTVVPNLGFAFLKAPVVF